MGRSLRTDEMHGNIFQTRQQTGQRKGGQTGRQTTKTQAERQPGEQRLCSSASLCCSQVHLLLLRTILRSVSHSFSAITLPSILPSRSPNVAPSAYTHITFCSFSSLTCTIPPTFISPTSPPWLICPSTSICYFV